MSTQGKSIGELVVKLAQILKGSAIAKAGLALITIGGLLLSPGYLIPAALWIAGRPLPDVLQQITPDPILGAIGILCLIGGFVLIILRYVQERAQLLPEVIAINHQSFDGNARDLRSADLPAALSKAKIWQLVIDQNAWFDAGVLNAQPALRQLETFPAQLGALRRSTPNAEVAFAGKAHIPLAFTFAHRCLSEVPLLHFELDRSTGAWRHLPDLGRRLEVTLDIDDAVCERNDAVIKVEVSYAIDDRDVAVIVPEARGRAVIAVAGPQLDCLTSRADVEHIADLFRASLDALTGAARIHVFIAGPMSVVTALGRRVSPTIHGAVIVHNYTAKTTPRYAWGIHVNAKNGPQVVLNKCRK